MPKVPRCNATLVLIILLTAVALAQDRPADPVMAVMKQELERSLANLKGKPQPPYFLAYQLTDNRAIQVSGSFGTLISSDDHRTRVLDVDLRTGDYALDNTHPMRGGFSGLDFSSFRGGSVPLEDDPAALRRALWHRTDQEYKAAIERLQEVKANVQVRVEAEDKSPDFSREAPVSYSEPEAPFAFDRALWEQKVRTFSAPFREHPDLYEGAVAAMAELETRRYVSSDGSEIRISLPLYRLMITASTKAEDGMELPLHETFLAFSAGGLPDDAAVQKTVEEMIRKLLELRKAPVAEPYTGPAILSGRSSAVFFHEIFGHRVEGHRQKDEDEGQTFKKKVGQPVLPASFSVHSDPTQRRMGSSDLAGFYLYDDEGVKARRVALVEKGVLKNFLMSRSPIENFDHSNGHGRRQQGFPVVARQSNLLVESSKPVPRAELKKMLIAQVKAAGKPYGLLFDDIEGGFTFTQRTIPNAFNVMPTVVYRVYPDGREELVRGVDLIGTPLIAFSKIEAADDDVQVFNGICGAESGWVPVSAVSPGLLVAQIETQRKEKSQERPPILPPPAQEGK
ncbi:MAG: TldD/PmbA family protein [Terriglobales bacterium]